MAGKTFLWIEDRKGKASYIFWNAFLEQLCPEIKVKNKDIEKKNFGKLAEQKK